MSFKTHMQIIGLVFLLVYGVFFVVFERVEERRTVEGLVHHAQVIENALWNLDIEAARVYLVLAATSDNYENLQAIDTNGKAFVEVIGPRLTLLDRLFRLVGLLPSEKHLVPIMHGDKVIGQLAAQHRHRTIYFHLNVLVTLCLLIAAYIFCLRTLMAKRTLEDRVAERTGELARAVAQAQESEERFRAFSEQTILGLIACQEDRFTFGNQAAATIFGYRVDELHFRPVDRFVDQICLTPEGGRQLKRHLEGKLDRLVWQARNTAGEIRWVESLSRVISFNDQKAVLVGLVDVTDRKAIEEELRQRDKMDSLGQLAGGIAHDFNNMLGGIMGAAELLSMKIARQAEERKYVDVIVETAGRAAELTGKLLAFSRKEPLKSESFDLHDRLADVISLLEHTLDRRIKIESRLDAERSGMTGDGAQIENALLNLAVNARDAMENGGIIRFTTANLALDRSYCELSRFDIQPGEYIHLSIEDNGHGIPVEILPKIFEPFFTTKQVGAGTGLGLFTVYGTVVDHHGAVFVDSEQGRGTVFHIYFPVSAEVEAVDIDEKLPSGSGDGTILVIDDEPIIRETARAMLEVLGFDVLVAADGKQGLAVYDKSGGQIQAVLLDMVMPVMDGYACFAELRRRSPNLPIVVCSGFSSSDAVNKLIDQGGAVLLRKPYRVAKLDQALKEVLPGV